MLMILFTAFFVRLYCCTSSFIVVVAIIYCTVFLFLLQFIALEGLNSGVPTRTTPTLTPTTLRSIEQTFIELQSKSESHENEAGFVPPLVHSIGELAENRGYAIHFADMNSEKRFGGSFFWNYTGRKYYFTFSTLLNPVVHIVLIDTKNR